MGTILRGFSYEPCLVYLDDIIIGRTHDIAQRLFEQYPEGAGEIENG